MKFREDLLNGFKFYSGHDFVTNRRTDGETTMAKTVSSYSKTGDINTETPKAQTEREREREKKAKWVATGGGAQSACLGTSKYSEPSLQRQHLFPKMLPLKYMCCCYESLISRMICKKGLVIPISSRKICLGYVRIASVSRF